MQAASLRERLLGGRQLSGLFIKTPAYEIVEVCALAGLDFICLDAEHAPFDRGRLDSCLAMSRALGLAALVRISHASQEAILQALDSGASGLLVPHVESVDTARNVVRWSHFGNRGRGYSGSTRASGFTTVTMAEMRAKSAEETLVIGQIEDPSGVDDVEAIAAVDGIDALFLGEADLAVGYGAASKSEPAVTAAVDRTIAAAQRAGKPVASFVGSPADIASARDKGISMVIVGSEQSLILNGARAIAKASASLS
jgi:2-keto-3-deoxy-L-rhamnonate aldolase RhmA